MRLFLAACLFFLTISTAHAATELVVYTDLEPEGLQKYAQAFNAKHPDIALKWVRNSAGPIMARLVAEKDAPKADVAFGLVLAALLTAEKHDLFIPYTPKGREDLEPAMYDHRTPPVWVGVNAWGSAFCVNTKELEKKGLPMPTSWADLTDPRYKGLLVSPNPAASGTGLSAVDALLQSQGEEAAWGLMEKLDANTKMYVPSGCKPCQMAAVGETTIGIASHVCAKTYIEKKAPLHLVYPSDGLGWDIEAVAIVKGTKNLEAAQKLVDFATSPEAAHIAKEFYAVPVRKDMQTPETAKIIKLFLPVDREKAAANRDTTLNEWRERFEKR